MQTLLRSVGNIPTYNPAARRLVHRTSAGNLVVVVYDRNYSGINPGGDQTNVGKFYVFTSANNGSTFTLRATVSTDLSTVTAVVSSCMDANNNIHIVWRSQSQTLLRYQQITWASGDTYTAGTQYTILTVSGGSLIGRCDIDAVGAAGNNVVVSAIYNSSTTSGINLIAVTGGGTGIYPSANLHIRPTDKVNSVGTSIAMSHDAGVGGTSYSGMVEYSKSMVNAGDLGNELIFFTWDSTSHAFSIIQRQTLNTTGYGDRVFWAYTTHTGQEFTIVGVSVTVHNWVAARYKVSADQTTVATVISPSYHNYVPIARITTTSGSVRQTVSVQILNNGLYLGSQYSPDAVAFFAAINGRGYYAQTVQFNAGSVSWSDNYGSFDAYSVGQGEAAQYTGGTNRNNQSDMGMICWKQQNRAGNNVYRAYYESFPAPTAAGTLLAPTGTTVTDFPTFKVTLTYPAGGADAPRLYALFEVATDAAFTTNYQMFTPSASSAIDSRAGSTYTYKATTRLAAGTYFCRWSEIDIFGHVSAVSATKTFTLAHVPAATQLSPDNDTYIPLIGGNVSLSWTFTDPAADDSQQAYQVVITSTADGSSVADTGTVVSSASNALVAVGGAYLDTELSWKVRVRDRDAEWSPYSTAATILVGALPTPAVTNPIGNSVIATGQPNVAWNPGVTAGKTQQYFRVQLLMSGSTVYDSGKVRSSLTTFTIPPGKIHNNKSYTVTVDVTDSSGLTGSASANFSTSYVIPASAPAPTVYSYDYDKHGYVHVGFSGVNIDPNFYCWNIYRQKVGSIEIELIAQIPNIRNVYGYRDTTASANAKYDYWVTQTVSRTGDLVESTDTNITEVMVTGSLYYLIDTLDQVMPLPLYDMNGDTWTDEHEESVSTILGRGRHVERGTNLGPNGTLSGALRDRTIGLNAGYNYLKNPSLLQKINDGVNPDNWLIAAIGGYSGAVVLGYDTFLECSPNAQAQPFTVYADSIPTATFDADNSDQKSIAFVPPSGVHIGPTQLNPNGICTVSCWVAEDPGITRNVRIGASIQCYTAASVMLNNLQPIMTLVETSPGGNWKRYAYTYVIPGSTEYISTSFNFFASTGATGPMKVWVGGMMVNPGSLIPYFDGDTTSCIWLNGVGGWSQCYGTYTARQQRLDIEDRQDLNRPFYLRTPFGDVIYASLGDKQNTRIAGVGANDFTDISLPYRQVAY